MNERLTDEELQSPELWDSEQGEVKSPRKAKRAVVSVAFNGEDFNTVVSAAKKEGMRTSEFIRNAALEKASPSSGTASFEWQGGSMGTSTYAQMVSITQGATREPFEPVYYSLSS